MTRTIVGVLRGGNSNEYALSLKTGAAMLAALPEDRYDVRDILIDRQGSWHLRGIPVQPARALSQIDVALNAIHGGVGEDGTVNRILRRAAIPYAGSSPHASGLSLHKMRARETLFRHGILVPQGIGFSIDDDMNTAQMAHMVLAQFAPPYVVKPPTDGASMGIRIAATVVELPDLIADVLDAYGAVLIEEFIRGKEASVGIIEKFRDQELYALPPAHAVVSNGSRHIEAMQHQTGDLQYVVPSNFTFEEKEALEHAARKAHVALGLGHFSRADIMLAHISKKPRAYVLEVNSIPGLYEGASFPLMLESVGSNVTEFLEHSINLARGHV